MAVALTSSVIAIPMERRQSFPTVTRIDDSSCNIEYDRAWTRLRNQGSKYIDGTLSYTAEPNA